MSDEENVVHRLGGVVLALFLLLLVAGLIAQFAWGATDHLRRIADALERAHPPAPAGAVEEK